MVLVTPKCWAKSKNTVEHNLVKHCQHNFIGRHALIEIMVFWSLCITNVLERDALLFPVITQPHFSCPHIPLSAWIFLTIRCCSHSDSSAIFFFNSKIVDSKAHVSSLFASSLYFNVWISTSTLSHSLDNFSLAACNSFILPLCQNKKHYKRHRKHCKFPIHWSDKILSTYLFTVLSESNLFCFRRLLWF